MSDSPGRVLDVVAGFSASGLASRPTWRRAPEPAASAFPAAAWFVSGLPVPSARTEAANIEPPDESQGQARSGRDRSELEVAEAVSVSVPDINLAPPTLV